MAVWNIIYFPASGELHSPYDFIRNLDRQEQASLAHRLQTLANMRLSDWPGPWYRKLAGPLWEIKIGKIRVMYCLDERALVILHVCRKVKQKALPKDIDRAIANYNNYLLWKQRKE